MPKVSIVVPVYNVEKYLDRCIESLVNQTLKDIEIILVDDGSPDNCPEMCDEWAKKDDRIVVVHKENEGASYARNTGIELSKGEYIAFVDSDDYVDKNMYDDMVMTADRYNCDMILCDVLKETADEQFTFSHNIREGYYSKKQLIEEYYPNLLMTNSVDFPATISHCAILFNNKFMHKNGFRYEKIRYSEDLLFGAIAIYNANSFYYMKGKAYYHYVYNRESVSHTEKPGLWENYLKLYEFISNYFLSQKEYDFSQQVCICLLYFLYSSVNNIKNSSMTLINKYSKVKEIAKNIKVREMFKLLNLRNLDIPLTLRLRTYVYKSRFTALWFLMVLF